MSPLIMRTCAEFLDLGYSVELWVPYRRDVVIDADPFKQHHINLHFPVKRLPSLDLISPLGKIGFFFLLISFNFIALLHLVVRRLKGERFIIYAHDMRDVILPSLLGEPIFVEIHDYFESSLRWLNVFVLQRVTGLIVTNMIKVTHIHKQYGFPQYRMIHQPNAVEAEMFDIDVSKDAARKILNLPSDRIIALYAGHLFRWKGVYTLADAARYLHGIHIYFVGGTEEDRKALQVYVQNGGIEGIEFLPYQDHARIPLFLKAADVLVLPNTATDDVSKYETSPVKLFEYMASGTPVVATKLPSILDIISGDMATFVVPDNPEAMASGIADAIIRKDEIRCEQAKTWARGHSWEARAQNINLLISRLAD